MVRFPTLAVMSAVLETSGLLPWRARRWSPRPVSPVAGKAPEPQPAPPIDTIDQDHPDRGEPTTAFDLHQRSLEVLDDLLDANESERARWFAQAGGVDPVLANQVALLLRAEAMGSRVLPTDVPEPACVPTLATPDRIGPYRLVSRLGQGGMGEVFLGRRDDGLFEQSVAIKIVKTGKLTPQLATRFAEERRILAKLQHPHIAQLFDGGIDASTHSFIVMEYLDGQILTNHIEHDRVGTVGILRLFLDVCSAVQFAHQNFIVHADIKPSNVIVTPKSGVKLLDFGIAQLIDPALGSAQTSQGHEPMTRAYAAPERLAGFAPSVAGDVYSLGALLFELLVGMLPSNGLTKQRKHPPGWGAASAALKARGGDGPVRVGELRGDLDTIIAKALAAKAGERYPSVVALADDIDRHLRRLPVRARADTWQYRTSKFVARHRLGLAVTGVFMTALGAGAVAMTHLYLQSEQARTRAVQRFGETRTMANYMIFDVDPQLARLPGSLSLRRSIVSNAHAYLKALQADPNTSAALKLEIANGYLRLARIYGLDVTGGIGDLPAARSSLRQAKSIIASVKPDTLNRSTLQLAQADADVVTANESFVSPDPRTMATTLKALQSATKEYQAILGRRPGEVDAALGRWRSQVMAGRIFQYLGRSEDAIATVESNLNLPRPEAKTESQTFESNYLKTASYLILAENYQDHQDLDKALSYYAALNRTLLALDKTTHESVDNDYLRSSALSGMATIYLDKGDAARSIDLYQQSLALMRRVLTFGPNDAVSLSLSQVTVRLANALSSGHRFVEAASLMEEAIAEVRRRTVKDPGNGGIERILALNLGAAAILKHRAGDESGGCARDRQDRDQWAKSQKLSGELPMDMGAGGPLDALKARLKHCGPS